MPRIIVLLSLVLSLSCHSALAGDYFPIKAGNHWYYTKYDSSGTRTGVDTAEMRDHQTVDKIPDIDKYEIERNDDGASGWGDTFLRDSGQYVYASRDGFWFNGPYKYAVHSFYKITSFVSEFQTLTPRYVGKVTVPAGTFDSCYEVTSSNKDYGATRYYAPGVGLIKYVSITKIYLTLDAYVAGSTYTGILARPQERSSSKASPSNRFQWKREPVWFAADGRRARIPFRP